MNKKEAIKGEKENYDMHVNVCPTNEDAATIEETRLLIRKARTCRANSDDSKQQDIRNFGVSR